MRAGNLNKLITIQSLVNGQDEFGQPLEASWVEFKQVRASIVPVNLQKGDEIFVANADFSLVLHRIKIRYINGVNASMRAICDGRVFNFVSVRDISERNREIEILAKENINGN